MLSIMGFDELSAQATAELTRVNALLGDPAITGPRRTALEGARTRLVAMQREIATAKQAFANHTRPLTDLGAELTRLRGVPAPSGATPTDRAGLLALHQLIEGP
jgi:hypothetical protein